MLSSRLLIFIVLLFLAMHVMFASTLFSQSLDGSYWMGGQSFHVQGDKIRYTFHSGGGVVFIYSGNGTFQLKDGRLLIDPDLSHMANSIQAIPSEHSDTMSIQVHCDDAEGVVIALLDEGRLIAGVSTNKQGVGKLPRRLVAQSDVMVVRMMFYGEQRIIPDKTRLLDYSVRLDPAPGMDQHRAFITNNGQGWEVKVYADSVDVKFGEYVGGGIEDIWHRFRKNQKF